MTEPVQHVEYHDHHAEHPTPRAYVWVAILLAVVTAIEVAIYYFNLPDWALIAGLMVFALVKFLFVARWFMHLKFDERVFRMLFITGIITALFVFSIVLSIFFLAGDGGPAPLVNGGG
jgi:cytochrome c oxidase subunit IV